MKRGDETLRAIEVPPPAKVLRAEASPDGSAMFVWRADADGPTRVERYDARGERADCVIEMQGSSRRPGAVEWTPGGGLLHRWGAGTYAAQLISYGSKCARRLSLAAPAVDVAPSRRHVVTYPPEGAPLASDRAVRVHDLVTGRQIGDAIDAGRTGHVSRITWSDASVTIRIASDDGGSRTLTRALDSGQ